jgi:membrane protease YdiL (CAAX protease family)
LNSTIFLAHVAEWLGVIAVVWFLARIPRYQVKPVGFKYARRDGIMALSLGATAIFFSLIFSTTELHNLAPRFLPVSGPAADLTYLLFIALVSLLPFLAALLTRGQPALSAGWNRTNQRVGLQVGLAVALLTILLRNRALDLINGIQKDELSYLLLALGIALVEETMFRGYIQLRLCWWMGDKKGWILTGLLFGLYRFPIFLAAVGLNAALFYLGIILVEGLLAGWLMRKTGHVLAPGLYRAVSIWLNVFV